MRMRLPQDKLLDSKAKVDDMYRRKKVSLRQLQSPIGSLNFACKVVITGRTFLRRLIDLTKDLFPNQLSKLLESMGDCMHTNILSGFRKCGRLDRNQVLGRLPRGAGDKQHEESANQISKAFLHNFNALRYPENDPVTKRRKRVKVEGGKRITSSDFVNDRDNPAEPVPGPSNGDAEKDDSMASEAVAESDDAMDSEDNDVHDSDVLQPVTPGCVQLVNGYWQNMKLQNISRQKYDGWKTGKGRTQGATACQLAIRITWRTRCFYSGT